MSVAHVYFFLAETCEEESLSVEIHYYYRQPSDFTLSPPYFRIASSIVLKCVVPGSAGQVSYNWSSDCSGNCFVNGQTTRSVGTRILQPSDSGVHTCTARDFVGVDCIRNASASLDMTIVGKCIRMHIFYKHLFVLFASIYYCK